MSPHDHATRPGGSTGRISRRWSATASVEGAGAYEEHFRESVLPALARVEGHLGACLLVRPLDDGLEELVVVTTWTSMDAIRSFAGDAPEVAVVEPAAREALETFDEEVTHHEVVVDTGR